MRKIPGLPTLPDLMLGSHPKPGQNCTPVHLFSKKSMIGDSHCWAQVDFAPAALLSVNTIAGDAPPIGQQGFGVVTRVRLLVSPVVPVFSQVGAIVVPLSTLVLTTIVDPVLKTAWDKPPSPNTLNSAACHSVARPATLLLPATEYRLLPIDKMTSSVPPELALPVRLRLPRVAIV